MPKQLQTPTDALAVPCGDRCAHRAVVLAEVLKHHQQAAGRGKPWLTEQGVAAVRERLAAARAGARPRPRWLGDRLELRLGDRLLREFRHGAPCQILLLHAFDARGWPDEPIPSPLPRARRDSFAARRRLVDTLKNLNRMLPRGTIHFRLVPGTTSVRWEYAPARRPGRRARPERHKRDATVP